VLDATARIAPNKKWTIPFSPVAEQVDEIILANPNPDVSLAIMWTREKNRCIAKIYFVPPPKKGEIKANGYPGGPGEKKAKTVDNTRFTDFESVLSKLLKNWGEPAPNPRFVRAVMKAAGPTMPAEFYHPIAERKTISRFKARKNPQTGILINFATDARKLWDEKRAAEVLADAAISLTDPPPAMDFDTEPDPAPANSAEPEKKPATPRPTDPEREENARQAKAEQRRREAEEIAKRKEKYRK